MFRGITLFKCTECGKHFSAPDIEWRATVMSAPCKCPQCGSIRTLPSGGNSKLYEHIWEMMEKQNAIKNPVNQEKNDDSIQ